MSATETIGDTSAMASSGLNRDVTPEETPGQLPAMVLSVHYQQCLAVCQLLHLAKMWA